VQGKIKLLKALADETRVKIVQCLMDGERCACTLVPAVGKAQPTVSQHLRILEEAGVLESRRDGVNIWYRIRSDQAVQILKILNIQSIEIPISCSGGDRDER
jgi:ArsR family transcriptional regulator